MNTTLRELSLAHLSVLDATPPELVKVAAAAGFRKIGIRISATPSVGVPPYDMLGDTPVLRETLARLADTGVSVLDVEFLRFEPEVPQGIPEGFLEAGARLGAQYVLVMSTEPLEARTVERFCGLCDRAHQYGLHVCLEFAIYTGVKTLADADDYDEDPYKGSAPALADVMAGHIDMLMDSVPTSLPQIEAGNTRALAVTSGVRNMRLPHVPTMMEAGIPNYDTAAWGSLMAPAGSPPDRYRSIPARS